MSLFGVFQIWKGNTVCTPYTLLAEPPYYILLSRTSIFLQKNLWILTSVNKVNKLIVSHFFTFRFCLQIDLYRIYGNFLVFKIFGFHNYEQLIMEPYFDLQFVVFKVFLSPDRSNFPSSVVPIRLENFLCISCSTDMLGKTCFLFENVFISPSFLKDSFAGY